MQYSGPYWSPREIELATEALTKGKWLTAGEYVTRFQNEFSRKFNVKYSHMVNSGSSANLVMLAALKKRFKWQDGDEIIVSPVGFPTTIAPIVQNGLKPVFVDIEMASLNFDLFEVQAAMTERTKAIFVSPVLGNPPNIDVLVDVCKDQNLLLIGDNCDSLGTKWNNRYLNEYYVAWSTSFYPAHHITTGEGGMVCSDDKEIIDLARSISWWGRDCYCIGAANLLPCGTCGTRFSNWLGGDTILDHKYVFTNIGYNLKPLDLQGAIGLAQLEKFDEIEKARRENFKQISTFFSDFTVRTVRIYDEADPCWFGVPFVCFDESIKNGLVKHFEDHKIQTRSYFAGNILRHPGYSHLGKPEDFRNAEQALKRVFFIGCAPQYTKEVLNYIGEVFKKW